VEGHDQKNFPGALRPTGAPLPLSN